MQVQRTNPENMFKTHQQILTEWWYNQFNLRLMGKRKNLWAGKKKKSAHKQLQRQNKLLANKVAQMKELSP